MKMYSITLENIIFKTIAKNKYQALINFRSQVLGASNIGIYLNPDWLKIKNVKVNGRVL